MDTTAHVGTVKSHGKVGRNGSDDSCGSAAARKPVCAGSICYGTSMPRSKLTALGRRLRRGGGGSRPPAPVDLSPEVKVAVAIPVGGAANVVGPTLDLLQELAPRGVDAQPLGAVPFSPEVAYDIRCQDVANGGLGHVPAAVAVEGGGADPVVRGDGAERIGLQQQRPSTPRLHSR